MKSIYDLCREKGITTKQLFQEVKKSVSILKEAQWQGMVKSNEFSIQVANRICDIFDVGLNEIDIRIEGLVEKVKAKPIDSKVFKKADLSKIKNLPKASDKLCMGKFGQCGSSQGVQRAHYTGEFQHLFGKGHGKKGHDACSAYLCSGNNGCHERLDQPKNRKCRESSHEFSIAINLSNKLDFDNGVLIYKG